MTPYVLKLYLVTPGSKHCILEHPYNKRFTTFVSGGVPSAYRSYNETTKQWSVHVSRLPQVVAMGRRMFQHVDYSSLPESMQIRLVKGIEDGAEQTGPRSFAPVFKRLSAAGPHAVLFVLPTAPWEVVEAAYKALVFKTHPDRGGSVEDFQRVQKAFEELKKTRKS